MNSEWQAGAHVDDYQLEERLGGGGMGDVFRARHMPTGAVRALKALPRGVSQDALLRFQREAEAQAAVDSHPNVVRIHSSGRAAGRHYLVMDLAPGGDLATRLREGPLEPLAAALLVEQLAHGMAHTHANGVLHRDLKPANVVFGEDGTPRLVDFGVARIAGQDGLTQTGAMIGTPAYMAPEQARGETTDERIDVYGLGAVLYAALTGRAPFVSEGLKLLHDVASEEPTPPSQLRPGIPEGIERTCLLALSKSPKQRPASASALAEALARARTADADDSKARGRVALLASGSALALALLLLVFAWPGKTASPESAPDSVPEGLGTAPVASEVAPTQASQVSNPPWIDPDYQGALPPIPTPELQLTPDPEIYRALNESGTAALARLREAEDKDALLDVATAVANKVGVSSPQAPVLHLYLRAREAGHPSGGFHAAELLRHHPEVQDLERAALLFAENAHRHDDPRGMFNLAEMLYLGQGLVCDPAMARRWLERAIARRDVANGQPYALLGEMLLEGHGGPADPERARRLFEEGRERPFRGDRALIGLARLLPPEERLDYLSGEVEARGISHPLVMVVLGDLYRDAGKLDRAEACYSVARRGSPAWYRQLAFLRLAEARRLGWGGDRGWDRGKAWLEQAAAVGSPEALLKLADDPKTAPEKARANIMKAARQGDPTAMERYAKLLGPGEAADAWLERARRRRLVTR